MKKVKEIGVLNIVDSLAAAGAERMAVNIANALAENGVESYLCATRASGELAQFFYDSNKLLIANKKSTFDFTAFLRIYRFVKQKRISVIHAHSSSLFWAILLKLTSPSLKIVWHDHFGMSDFLHLRSKLQFVLMRPLISYVYVVNSNLYKYAVDVIKFKPSIVRYLPNFPNLDIESAKNVTASIPNVQLEPKIVHLANIRPQKDHNTLLSAFERVLEKYPNAQLYLVGGDNKDSYLEDVKSLVNNSVKLKKSVHLLGSRSDVAEILVTCNLGVLSSVSEGLPVSLLEYGLAALPVVCTNVGECGVVLKDGDLGWLVPASDANLLSVAMVDALINDELAKDKAQRFKLHIENNYGKKGVVAQIVEMYKSILNGNEKE